MTTRDKLKVSLNVSRTEVNLFSHTMNTNFDFSGPFRTGTGAGLNLTAAAAAAYNPTYAAALYGAAFGAAGAYDPAVYPASYAAGLQVHPSYSPGTFGATASGYPGGGYDYPYGAARDMRYPGMQAVQSKEVLNAQ